MTYEDIQNAIDKQIQYQELADLLEVDLNNISDRINEDPQKLIVFKVFFDTGEFNTVVQEGGYGEGTGFRITPILLRFVNGDYGTLKGPQFFSTVFNIEVMGYDDQRTELRKIFETYSYMNQGIIDKDEVGIYITKTLEFPIFSEPFQLKGSMRTQGFMRLFINYMHNGQMSNDVIYKLDGGEVLIQGFALSRQRTPRADQMNTETETTNIYESQVITFSGSMIYDGSYAAKKLLRGLKTLNSGLNQKYKFEIIYPNIFEGEYGWVHSTNQEEQYTTTNTLPEPTEYGYGTIVKVEHFLVLADVGYQSHDFEIEAEPTLEGILAAMEVAYPADFAEFEIGEWDPTQVIRVEHGGDYSYFTIGYGGTRYFKLEEVDTEIPEQDEYIVYLDSGLITIDEGGVLFLNFTLALAEV